MTHLPRSTRRALAAPFALFSCLLGLLVLSGCRGGKRPEANTGAWPISATCDACLQKACGGTSAAPGAYSSCKGGQDCARAFAGFAQCYRSKGAIGGCQTELEAVKARGPSGSDLLSCYLLDCFAETCEVASRAKGSL